LIFILFSEKKFHIVADEGIHTKVQEGTWDGIAAVMSSHFTKGNFRSGIIEAVTSVGDILSNHFPRKAGDTNELSNDVVEK
jgi:putative membrane protein